jgi:hypothetical protein
MFKLCPALLSLAAVLCATTASAELQNTEIGGYTQVIGYYYGYDSLPSVAYADQWTRLHVKADFTNDVSAFIEFDSYTPWGDSFRSNYLTGIDARGAADVGLYQGYVEVRNLWGAPLTLKAGRQELRFGSEWLIGNNSDCTPVYGLSFDALRLTYAADTFTFDLVAAKLAERFVDFGKGDTDLHVAYASCTAVEDQTFDAYWMYLRDDGALNGFPTNLHTVGLRAAGKAGAFDYRAEGAYQFGGIDDLPSACPYPYTSGEADTKYDAFGADVKAGYTFDAAWSPRPFLWAAYLGGGDPDRSIWSNDRTLPFNRLFSDVEYTKIMAFTDMSNMRYYAVGVEVAPAESVTLKLTVGKIETDVPGPDTGCLWWKRHASRNLGWEMDLFANYQYSEDLAFFAMYGHLFGDRGLEGSHVIGNGLYPWNGNRDDQYDVFYAGTSLEF